MNEKIIILICGVPGAGKTTITNLLYNLLINNNNKTFKISFDDFQVQKELWNENTFIESRRNCLEYLINILKEENENENENKYFLIDDIMYYRSMRKKVYKIAKNYYSRFIIIRVLTSLENCLLRNSTRSNDTRIPDDIIINIWNHFEPPSKTFKWEKHSILCESDDIMIPSNWDQFVQKVFTAINEVKLDHFQDPILPSIDIKAPSPASVLQKLDLQLRQIISKIMKLICSSKYSLNKDQKKKVVEILSIKKDIVYSEARYGYYHQTQYHKKQNLDKNIDNKDNKISTINSDSDSDSDSDIDDENKDNHENNQMKEEKWIENKISCFAELNMNLIQESHLDCENSLLQIIADCVLQVTQNT